MTLRYFNIAAAARCAPETVDAVHQHLLLEARVGPRQAFTVAAPLIDRARSRTAHLLGATPQEIAFCPSGAAAFGLAFAAFQSLGKGDRVLVGRQEWGGNLANYERIGARVEVIPCDENGAVDSTALHAMIDERVKLIALTWLPANGGLINDAESVGRVARAAGVPYFIDAAQALGHVPIDVEALGCDVLFGPGRKHLRGPRGSAILYVRSSFTQQLVPAWVDVTSAPWQSGRYHLAADALRFDMSESMVATLAGFARSIDEALLEGVANRFEQAQTLARELRGELNDLRGVQLLDPAQASLSGIVTFNLEAHSAQHVADELARHCVIVTAHPRAYTPLDMQARGLDSLVRASVSSLTTRDDIAALVSALKGILAADGLR